MTADRIAALPDRPLFKSSNAGDPDGDNQLRASMAQRMRKIDSFKNRSPVSTLLAREDLEFVKRYYGLVDTALIAHELGRSPAAVVCMAQMIEREGRWERSVGSV